jgi:hypothetical protein
MTFTYPAKLAVLRTRLEADGIECRVLDELTVQVNPFYSNAIGGIKLQVKESDMQMAIAILKDGGYIKDEDLQTPQMPNKFDKMTSRIPLLKNLRPELRLMLIAAFVVLIFIGTIYFATLPSTYERLTKQTWCVEQVIYNGEAYIPNTVAQFRLVAVGEECCQEEINIWKYGTISLPGFNSRSVKGKWLLDGKSLQISQTDTFDFVYNGVYDINFSGNTLILKSKQTTLYCYPQNNYINLPF